MNANGTNETAKNLVKIVQESSKALTDTAIASQEHNLAFAQNTLENGIEVLKSHVESTRTLMQELVGQARKQQIGPEDLQHLLDGAVVAQERNIKFAQSVFEDGIELFKSQIGVTRSLLLTLERQSQKSQVALQALAQESMEAYQDFFFAPLSYWQKALNTTESVTQEGLKNFQVAAQQGMENMQKTARQAASMMEEPMSRR